MPKKRPSLALLRRGASVVPSPEIHSASSSLESAFSFHQQNVRTAFLFGKNNVLAFSGDREAPGYLSLHHDQNRMLILKWIPNSLLLSKPGGSTTNAVKSPSHSSHCVPVSIKFETVSHLHLHKNEGTLSSSIVLIDSDGVQQFCFSFSLEQHCFSFLKTLEGALFPLFKIDPPLNSIKIECGATGRPLMGIRFYFQFVLLCPFAVDSTIKPSTLFKSTDCSHQKGPLVEKPGSELVFRIISFASPSFDQKMPLENRSFSRSSTQESAKCEGQQPKISLRESLSNATKAMQSQILARAFLGWLTYSQHLRKIRLNLASIVTIERFIPNSDGMEVPVNEAFWRICRSEKTIVLFKQFLTRVYFCGIEPTLRAKVWPYLLRLIEWHEDFGRCELDAIDLTYRNDLKEWTEMNAKLIPDNEQINGVEEEEEELSDSLSTHQSEEDFSRHFPHIGSMNSEVFEESGVYLEEKRTTNFCKKEKAFSKEFANNLLRIKKDVDRCDRTTKFYSCHDNLDILHRIICTYIFRRLKLDLEDGYVQGMCDLVAPLLVVFRHEALTLACFERLMLRLRRNFPQSAQNNGGMEENLNNFRSLVEVMDPELYCQLMRNIDYSFVVFYRWLLLDFKRELVYKEVFQLWEVIWAAEMSCSRHFELFFGLALLSQYRDVLIENEMDFTDVIKFFNEMAEKHNADDLLNIARQKLQTFQEVMLNLNGTN